MNLLFLGASNTDCGHCFTPDNLGNGYVKFVFEKLQGNCLERGLNLTVTNGGTDGFTFSRIYEKWNRTYRGTAYDAVVILGGINEVGVIHNTGLTDVQADAYLHDSAKALSCLLQGLIAEDVPHILVVEPFLFGTPDYLNLWKPTLGRVRHLIHNCICSYRNFSESIMTRSEKRQSFLHFLPIQAELNQLAEEIGLNQVTSDGIHLAEAGHLHLAEKLTEFLMPLLFESN